MTNDQADHLRRLMHGQRSTPVEKNAARLIVVAGAKGGVGTTTIAVNLAVVIAQRGTRTVLVDGDLGKADAAALCDLNGGPNIGDILAGRRQAENTLQAGPADVRVLAGAWATGHLTDCNAAAQERLIAELTGLADADAVVIDAGCGMDRVLQRFWTAADQVLLVTTPDDSSVMNAYSAMKSMASGKGHARAHAVINQSTCFDDARGAHTRLAHACRRFLATDLPCAAHVMASAEIRTAGQNRTPFVLSAPVCQASQTLAQLAQHLTTVNREAAGWGKAAPQDPIIADGFSRRCPGMVGTGASLADNAIR